MSYYCSHCEAGPYVSDASLFRHHATKHPECAPFVKATCLKSRAKGATTGPFKAGYTGRLQAPKAMEQTLATGDDKTAPTAPVPTPASFGTDVLAINPGRKRSLGMAFRSPERRISASGVPIFSIRPPPASPLRPSPPSYFPYTYKSLANKDTQNEDTKHEYEDYEYSEEDMSEYVDSESDDAETQAAENRVAEYQNVEDTDEDTDCANDIIERATESVMGDSDSPVRAQLTANTTDEMSSAWLPNPNTAIFTPQDLHTEALWYQGKTFRDAGALGGNLVDVTGLTNGLGYLEEVQNIDKTQSPEQIQRSCIKRSHALLGAALALAAFPDGLNHALELVHLAFRHCDSPVEESGDPVFTQELLVFFGRLDTVALEVLKHRLPAKSDAAVVKRFQTMEVSDKKYFLTGGRFFTKSWEYLETLE